MVDNQPRELSLEAVTPAKRSPSSHFLRTPDSNSSTQFFPSSLSLSRTTPSFSLQMTSKPPLTVLTRLTSQVHISATPPPRSLAESKQIFAALQGFGEIISFRNLKVRNPFCLLCNLGTQS